MVEEKKYVLELTAQEAYWLHYFLTNMRFTIEEGEMPKSITEKIKKTGAAL